MANLDHEAIYKAYAGTVFSVSDDLGAFDKDGKSVTLDQSKIDSARTELNTEAAKVKYKTDRTTNGSTIYPSIAEQLDMQYWDKKNGTTTWVDAIEKVKSDNPKP